MTQTNGEVYDIGYQHYTGPREGRALARKALWVNGVRTALGLGRGWPSKILPALLFFGLLTPALVFILIASTLGRVVAGLPGQSEYYSVIFVPLIILSAIIAPELLCSDRRERVLSLYLVRPITATDYVLGKWLAFLSIILVFVYLPQLLLFIGLTLGATDPLAYLKDNWLDFPRFILSGLALALFATTFPLAAASFTTRRAYAAVFVIGLWFIAGATGGILQEVTGGSLGAWLSLVNIGVVPIMINDLIFNDISDSMFHRQVPQAAVVGWYLILIAAPAWVLWWRYRRMTT